MELSLIFKNGHVNLLDVRGIYEFEDAHAEGAVNIPLSLIPLKIEEIRQMKGPIVAYCRSGNRSGQAMRYLKQQGFEEVYNGGSLEEIQQYMQTI